MSQPDKDPLDPTQRWKTRYYDALSEIEQKEKTWLEVERLLRHLTTRLTLATDTRHPPLSQSLATLRNEIRDGKDIVKLRSLIETISLQIGELDQIRSNRQSLRSPARILQTLLQRLTIPEALSRQYKEVDKQIQDMDEFADINGAVNQVAALLKQMFEAERHSVAPEDDAATDAPREERRMKLLERIFARHTSQPAAKVPATQAEHIESGENPAATSSSKEPTSDTDGAITYTPKTIAPAVGDLLLQLAMRLPNEVKRRINFRALKSHINKARKRKDLLPIIDVIAQNIAAAYEFETAETVSIDAGSFAVLAEAVKTLISHLKPPGDLQPKVAEIEQQFTAQSTKVDGLVHCLNSLANLVAEICKRLSVQRQELEGFFQQLANRLQELDQDLQTSGKMRHATHEQVMSMEREVRGEIHDIRTTMQSMVQLEQLKKTVDSRLDGLDTRIRHFRENEEERYQYAQSLIQQLTTKMQALEQDSEHLRERLAQTQQEAMQDPLTGLPNRKAYEDRVAAEVARCRRYPMPLTMVVWDVDMFKSINDTYGHAAGDRVLRVIGETLSSSIRETDFIARYGGEEFVLLLPQTSLDVASGVCEKLRQLIATTPFHFQDKPVSITLSGGLAALQENEAVNTLFERADAAMYRAKQVGRNRIEIAR